MNDQVLQQYTEGAEAYDRLMVPALFSAWAPQVCRAAGVAAGDAVLDLACGTGVLAREAWRIVNGRGRVCGVDLNPGMLAVARLRRPEIEWRHGAAEALPFPDASFDVVVSQFGLMFFDDRRRALAELRRVLKSGGRLAVAVWGSLTDNPAYAVEAAIVAAVAGDPAAAPIRAPFQLGDAETLVRLFRDAGIEDIDVATMEDTGRFPSVRAMVEADLRGWLPVMGIHLAEREIGAIVAQAERELAHFAAADGSIAFPITAHIAYGRTR